MLPIVWFFIAVVSSLWILLLYTELRKRARRRVKGCPSLSYISPELLNSLIIIAPDLEILELGVQHGNAAIPDAHQMRVDQLDGFVSHKSRSTIFVFCDSVKGPVNWRQVELLVCKYLLRNAFVRKGGLEAWKSHQQSPARHRSLVTNARMTTIETESWRCVPRNNCQPLRYFLKGGSMSHIYPPQHLDVSAWKKIKRLELLGRRAAMSPEDHRLKSASILKELGRLEAYFSGTIACYFPFRGEIDVLPLVEELFSNGYVTAFPVVLAQRTALQFRAWAPGCALEQGVYGIPHPVHGAIVEPDTFIVPLLGFDAQFYRLGYGGGFYDRTFAATIKVVRRIGIGFEAARVDSIHPQEFDIPMDVLITENGPRERQPGCNKR